MKTIRTIVCLAVVLVYFGRSQSVNYYVDAAGGNDARDGKSTATAWRTLGNVNVTTFLPGDSILLKSGSLWTGQLAPKGSGDSLQPVVIDKYGGIPKPRVDGGGIAGTGTFYLNNQQYWEINNLEITNDASSPGDRRGVLVAADNFGLVHHIYLRNLDIHHVKGIVGGGDTEKRTAGIGIETTNDAAVPTRYDDILIEGCKIDSVDNTGLYTDNMMSGSRQEYPGTGKWPQRSFTNARIRNNVISHISKNAMIIRFFLGGVVEYNVCYETAIKEDGNTIMTSACDGTVFQFNEGYFNRAKDADGSMYDVDLRSPRTIWQYSYSHDNAHGLFWSCTNQADSNVICRYNVSQNDKGIIFCINYPNTSVYCYNNTIYCGADVAPTIISERNGMSGTRTYYFYNNIIYSASANVKFDFKTWAAYARTLDNNVLFGFPSPPEIYDSHMMITDPKLLNPGSGGYGITTVGGYRLQPGSPCIDNGLLVPKNGGRDYFGVTVPVGRKPDLGAFEYIQTTGLLEGKPIQPDSYGLSQNFPNPFNPETEILYQLSTRQSVILAVYDLRGQRVRTLRRGIESPGSHNVRWDAKDDQGLPVSSGVYVARLLSGPDVFTVKMMLLR